MEISHDSTYWGSGSLTSSQGRGPVQTLNSFSYLHLDVFSVAINGSQRLRAIPQSMVHLKLWLCFVSLKQQIFDINRSHFVAVSWT